MKTRHYIPSLRGGTLTLLLLGLCLLTACTSGTPNSTQTPTPSETPQACVATTPGAPPPLSPTTLTTLEQAYWCLFDHYVTGKTLDDRVLLNGAFSGFVQALLRRGVDQPTAMLPALSGVGRPIGTPLAPCIST